MQAVFQRQYIYINDTERQFVPLGAKTGQMHDGGEIKRLLAIVRKRPSLPWSGRLGVVILIYFDSAKREAASSGFRFLHIIIS